ncbi:MAG: hypothetical protein JWR03_1620 [Cohnella sp.]|jgi:hypothetical protein|nr:hypothetical protein [Cohnella sp.]
MHQGSDDNIAVLDSIIKAIKKEGYEFKLIPHQVAPDNKPNLVLVHALSLN